MKLFIENTTTTQEVITLVVNQVSKATGGSNLNDFSDFYLVAAMGKKMWNLNPDYHPLQLQLYPEETGKVLLSIRRKSEETQLNQMVTSV